MSMNDVNMAPGNNNQPIKSTGSEEGESVQALGGGKVVGQFPLFLMGVGRRGLGKEISLMRVGVFYLSFLLACFPALHPKIPT